MSFGRLFWLSLAVPFCVGVSTAQINVTTANYGISRTNANTNESILTPQAVQTSFGKVGAFPVDGQIYAQPLYVGGLTIPGVGAKNVVFVATMNNTIYALDASNPASQTPLWQVNLGPAVPSAAIPDLTDINPQVGILSTPVIDPNAQILYAVAEVYQNGAPVFELHALSLANGQEMLNGPAIITASVTGTAPDAIDGVVSFDPFWHLQRPGLALANGMVYICFGSHGDAGYYHGWVMAYQASNLQPAGVFITTPNGGGGGIWQSGHAPMVDSVGNVYVVSGNGDFDGVANFSCSVIKLAANLSMLDFFTPAEWQYLNANDLDVGSTGAILSGNLILAGDKGGRLITLNPSKLGGVESTPGAQDFLASAAGIFDLAMWQTSGGTFLFEHDWNGYLKSYAVSSSGINETPVATGTWLGDSLYQGLAVSSNGASNGIVWETTGDHSQPGIPAILHAWDATTLTEIWDSTLNADDVVGSFATFVPPLVANGQVYVPTFSNQLGIYGLKSTGVSAAASPEISAVLNGASMLQNSVAPGEVVTILGTSLGPATVQNGALDANGNLAGVLGGTQVLFDGVAAPLLSVSATAVSAVVPFEVNGSTLMMVENGAGQSNPVSLPVDPTSPGLFSSSGLGTGQVSALNEDGTVNSATNPANAGSIVSLFATGLGQTNPPASDGAIANGVLALATAPISVLIGSLPAYVVYAGAAPGEVNGVYQINVRIPPTSPTGSVVLIVVQAGNADSSTDAWIAVQ